MSVFKQLILIGTVFSFLSISAYAEDTITVRYLGGYPLPGVSSEWMELRISRTGEIPGVASASPQDVDRLFEGVSATLAAHKVSNDWQLAIPDAPSIEITIDLDGHRRSFPVTSPLSGRTLPGHGAR